LNHSKKIKRHLFIEELWEQNEKTGKWECFKIDFKNPQEEILKKIYVDTPLVIAIKNENVFSTSSQPSLMGYMLELSEIKKNDIVLEIGTGSGYNASLISEIVGEENVFTVEIDHSIAVMAKRNIQRCGKKINVICGDGSKFYPDKNYNSVIVTCATPDIYWYKNIVDGGIVVIPLLTRGLEMLCKFKKIKNKFYGEVKLPVRFLTFAGINMILSDYKRNIEALGKLLLKGEKLEELSSEFTSLPPIKRVSFLFYLSLIEEDAIYYLPLKNEFPEGYGIWKKVFPQGIVLITRDGITHFGDKSVVDKLVKHFEEFKKKNITYRDFKIEAVKEKPERLSKDDIVVQKKFNTFIFRLK